MKQEKKQAAFLGGTRYFQYNDWNGQKFTYEALWIKQFSYTQPHTRYVEEEILTLSASRSSELLLCQRWCETLMSGGLANWTMLASTTT